MEGKIKEKEKINEKVFLYVFLVLPPVKNANLNEKMGNVYVEINIVH